MILWLLDVKLHDNNYLALGVYAVVFGVFLSFSQEQPLHVEEEYLNFP